MLVENVVKAQVLVENVVNAQVLVENFVKAQVFVENSAKWWYWKTLWRNNFLLHISCNHSAHSTARQIMTCSIIIQILGTLGQYLW